MFFPELNPQLRDPELYKKINIGFSRLEKETAKEKRKKQLAVLSALKLNKELTALAFDKKCEYFRIFLIFHLV
jgi:hypothetical protein